MWITSASGFPNADAGPVLETITPILIVSEDSSFGFALTSLFSPCVWFEPPLQPAVRNILKQMTKNDQTLVLFFHRNSAPNFSFNCS